MLSKNKVIHIDFGLSQEFSSLNNLAFGSWAKRFIKNAKLFTNSYDFELWKVYDTNIFGDRGIQIFERNGIRSKVFPAKRVLPFSKSNSSYISLSLLKNIKLLSNKDKKYIVHFQSVDGFMPYLTSFFCRKIPLVAQQRGPNMPFSWRFKKRKRFSYLFLNFFGLISYPNYDYIFSSSIGGFKYAKNKIGFDRCEHLKGGGFNYENNTPISKLEAKKKLGLDINKKHILYVGKYNNHKGVEVILKIGLKLKKKHNLELIFIGGSATDPLYQRLVSSGFKVFERVEKKIVLQYLNAADLYMLLLFDKVSLPFSDIGMIQLESLAMGTPDVSTTMIHFLGSQKDRKQVSRIVRHPNEALVSVDFILSNPEKYKNTRQISQKYYSWENICHKNFEIYDKLINKYYFL